MADDKKKKQIKLNDEQYLIEASNVADIYHQLALDLFDNVVDRVMERGTVYLDKQPYIWQLEKMNQMHLLNDENVKLIAERSGIAEEQLRYIIENEGLKVYTNTKQQLLDDLRQGGSIGDTTQIQTNLVNYANQAIDDLNNLINTTLPQSVIGAYQGIIQQSVARVVTGLSTADQAVSDTVMEWQKKGFYGFTDAGGRRWKADNYARSVIKTTMFRTFREMRTTPAEELGIDTYYYSKKAAAREMCAPLQHQIVTKGEARTEAGEKILSLYDYGYGTAGGCLGVNCGHMLTPFIPGANYKPDLGEDVESVTPEQAIENANLQAKQRALERSIRVTKEQAHVAEKLGDSDLIGKYNAKLKSQQMALKSLIDNNQFLKRDRERERYHEDPTTYAKQQIKLRKEHERLKRRRAEQKEMHKRFNSAVENGIIKTEINNEHYERHIRGTKGYEEYLAKNLSVGKSPPSYLTITKEECQELVDRYTGTGQFKYNPKSVKLQEIITQDKPIGTYIDPKTGEIVENATDFRIHYSKTGSHIVPTIKGKGSRK